MKYPKYMNLKILKSALKFCKPASGMRVESSNGLNCTPLKYKRKYFGSWLRIDYQSTIIRVRFLADFQIFFCSHALIYEELD